MLRFAPSFAKYPLDEVTYAAEKGNITLRCRPEGAPQPQFKWKKDGNTIASGGKYIIFDNGNLFIRQVTLSDGALYTCEAQNTEGKAESHGRLVVKQGPSFQTGVKPNPRVIAVHGETVELRCKAEASPLLDMAYSWKLNGTNFEWLFPELAFEFLSTLAFTNFLKSTFKF